MCSLFFQGRWAAQAASLLKELPRADDTEILESYAISSLDSQHMAYATRCEMIEILMNSLQLSFQGPQAFRYGWPVKYP